MHDIQVVLAIQVEIDFKGGDITSDGGGLLIRQADRKLDLTKQVFLLAAWRLAPG